jgi:uncharacterized protein (TIGR02597 family)
MRPSTLLFRAAGVAILSSIISAAPALSQTATTDPVGFITVNAAGNSDSYTFIPFKRTPEYAGAVLTPNGVAGSVITIAGTPNFTANQFVYVAGTQPKKYYVLLTSGPKVGMFYTITANGTNTLTLDPAGDDISGVSGATLNVIPYDTLGSIFPGGQGVNGSSTHSVGARQTEILIPDNSTPGIDLASAKSYYYYTGTAGVGPGWRLAGAIGALANDEILYPDTPFIVRHNVATGTSVTFMGTVHMGTLTTPVGTISAGVDQDVPVSLPIAANLTLAQTKLFESGAFAGSANHSVGSRQDQLLIWDNTIAGKDKAADRSYYYYTGTAGNGPGWRLAGDIGTVRNNEVVFTSATGIAIRKKATGTSAGAIWSVKPPYVP